ncbi:hypothetical protein [Actinomycetospora termitidis]|uniref:Uncharacterized protein n=1 Tax=Actinomycetospora termitidis TaxID=3053470 RepID=A0ABT7MFW0_9PSEU|nr:hypothetical protein [Actinomycetospora sp. Odt1-22]MDL5159562.1 hypothetical protein [Actinomycetospora sp. Odt1-22]
MSAGEFARDESAWEDLHGLNRVPLPPLERVPRERFDVPGTRGLRLRARWWLVTCGPTSRPWTAFVLCLLGIAGLFLPIAHTGDGSAPTPFDLALGPAVLTLVVFAVLTLLPVVDLVLGRERFTPWLAFPAALGMQVTLALVVVAGAQGGGALHPRLSDHGSGLGVGALVLGGVELALAVVGAVGFVRRAARRTLV